MPGQSDVRAGGAYVEIGTDNKALIRGLSGAKQRLGQFVNSIGNIGQKMMIAGGIFGAPLILAIKKASDFEETLSKFRAVFKQFTGDARGMAAAMAKELGRGEGDILRFMATIQDTLVPLGASRFAAMQFSGQVTKLAIDLASFNNMADDEVLILLQSALVGVHRSVRRFGVVITQARLEEELLNRGLKVGKKEAVELGKALARLKITMDGTSDAQGDAERTAGGFANMIKRLQARVGDLLETIGGKLIPITKPYIKLVTDIVKQIKDWAERNGVVVQTIGRIVAAIFGLGIALTAVSRGLQTVWSIVSIMLVIAPILAVANALGLIPQSIKDIILELKIGKQTLAEWIAPLQKALSSIWEKTKFGLTEFLGIAMTKIKNATVDLLAWLIKILPSVGKALTVGLFSLGKEAGDKVISSILGDLEKERPQPEEGGKGAWEKWKADRLKELAIIKEAFAKTFSGDKEVFENLERLLTPKPRPGTYDGVDIARTLRTIPGTFQSFRLAGVAAGGATKALNQVVTNTASIVAEAKRIAKNTSKPTARAGD